MPAGWTIQQITHCSASLACSDSLPNNSSAAALGEADLTTAATITRQVGKIVAATAVVTTATVLAQPQLTHPQVLTATVATAATINAVYVPAVTPGVADQGIGQLIVAVAGGVGP